MNAALTVNMNVQWMSNMDRLAKALGLRFCRYCGEEIVSIQASSDWKHLIHYIYTEPQARNDFVGFRTVGFDYQDVPIAHVAITREEWTD